MQNFKLIEKNKLTSDVYELVFKWEKEINMKPWQFITFLLEKIWWRAYSILESTDNKIVLTIKKRELDDGWRWWSKFICELEIWDTLRWVWPAWHFSLKENENNKLFLWTWVWIVPLYNQVVSAIKHKLNCNLTLIFWVQTEKDLFYLEKLEKLKKENKNFDFEVYLSREKNSNYKTWYITDFLTKENLEKFEEFYICWNPVMIESAKEILEKEWKENIYFEKF